MSVREHYQVMRVSRVSRAFLVVGPGRMASGGGVAPEAGRNRTRGERDRKAWSMLRDQPEEQMAAVCASATGFLSEGETTRREALVKPSPLFSDIPASECREIASAAHEKHFARRQSIFLEGDPVRRVVLLTSGSAKIVQLGPSGAEDRKSTRLNSSHGYISYAVFCLKKKKTDLSNTALQIGRQTQQLYQINGRKVQPDPFLALP